MLVKQIYDVLNPAMKQAFGEEAITATNLTDLVSEGNKLVAGAEASVLDKLSYGLLDRIYKVVIGIRKYETSENSVIREYETYGNILEKIYYEPIEAQKNATWDVVNGGTDDPFKITLVGTKVKFFGDRNSWEIPFSITNDQIKSAFTSTSELATFINGLYMIAENSVTAHIEKVCEWTVANFIGEKIHYDSQEEKKGIHVVKLVTNYNALHPTDEVTTENALENKNFLRYMSRVIRNYKEKFKKYSTLFNTEQFKRFTNDNDLKMLIISDVQNAMESVLESDTYHNDMVALSGFEPVAYWQGSGESFDTADCMKIHINTSSGNEVVASGIVGLMFDVDALGVTVWNKETTSQYNGHNKVTNYWKKCDIGLYNDLSENALVFQLV